MKSTVAGLIIAFACALQSCVSLAQEYPTKVITLIVPFAPGGPTDVMGRTIADELSKEFKQTVVVENRPGATGVVGLGSLERSEPDGHTLLLFPSSTAIAHVAQKKPFNLLKQATPVGNFLTQDAFLFVNPKMIDVSSLQDLERYLKKNIGASFTTSGVGSPSHIYTLAWSEGLGLKMTHIAYRGIAPAMMDVIGNRVPIILSTVTSIKPYIDDGSIRPIGILSAKRQSHFPNVATSVEQGYPDFTIPIYCGLLVTAGTPDAIVAKLRSALNRIVQGKAFRKVFDGTDGTPEFIDGPVWGDIIQKQYERAAQVARERNLTFQ